MVAEHEHALDRPSVRCLVAGKDLEPRVGQRLQLAGKTAVRQVARDHHGIRAVVAEPRERLDERLGVVRWIERLAALRERHMHVREKPKRQRGLPARESSRRGGKDPPRTTGEHARQTTNEKPPCQIHVIFSFNFCR